MFSARYIAAIAIVTDHRLPLVGNMRTQCRECLHPATLWRGHSRASDDLPTACLCFIHIGMHRLQNAAHQGRQICIPVFNAPLTCCNLSKMILSLYFAMGVMLPFGQNMPRVPFNPYVPLPGQAGFLIYIRIRVPNESAITMQLKHSPGYPDIQISRPSSPLPMIWLCVNLKAYRAAEEGL